MLKKRSKLRVVELVANKQLMRVSFTRVFANSHMSSTLQVGNQAMYNVLSTLVLHNCKLATTHFTKN